MIVTDLDGTLLREDKTVSERTKDALQCCREAGIRTTLPPDVGKAQAESFRQEAADEDAHFAQRFNVGKSSLIALLAVSASG